MMIEPFYLFIALIFALSVLTALWNATQTAVETGVTRVKHLAVVGSTIGLLAALGLGAAMMAVQGLGLALVASTIWLAVEERGSARLFCASQALFGAGIAGGLPFIVA